MTIERATSTTRPPAERKAVRKMNASKGKLQEEMTTTAEPDQTAAIQQDGSGVRWVTLRIPLADLHPAERSRDTISLRLNDHRHARAFNRFVLGCRKADLMLKGKSGAIRRVTAIPDCVRWLCELIEQANDETSD